VTDLLPPDVAARILDAAWQAADWRMALSAREAMLVATALAAVVAFGILAVVNGLLVATERAS
jgi:hypothetical protein